MGRKHKEEVWHADARQAVQVLKQGGILLHATDTVWGIACDATNDEAVERLNTIKERHPVHPVLVLVADDGHVEQLVDEVPEAAWDLMELGDRPTTVVYPKGKGVSSALLGGDGSLAIRCVREDYSAYIIRGLNKPLASTSANFTGHVAPKTFKDIPDALKQLVDHVSVHRREEVEGTGVPSMMVAFDEAGRFTFLRK
jgi:L-threonylcarbamoyladenylate synthase